MSDVSVEVEAPEETNEEPAAEVLAEVTAPILEETMDLTARVAVIESNYVTRDELAVVAASINQVGTEVKEVAMEVEKDVEEIKEDVQEVQEQIAEEEITDALEDEPEPAPVHHDEQPKSKEHWMWRKIGSGR